jgi:hypothetical protein
MHSLRSAHALDRVLLNALRAHARCISSTTPRRDGAGTPWFVDPNPITPSFLHRPSPPHIPTTQGKAPLVPSDAPDILKQLHAKLLESPHLDTSHLVVSPSVLPEPGPPLPLRAPHGRRKRGGTYAGESKFDETGGGIWSWVISAQVSSREALRNSDIF